MGWELVDKKTKNIVVHKAIKGYHFCGLLFSLWYQLWSFASFGIIFSFKPEVAPMQWDQIGRFLKFLCYKFYFKLSPNIWQRFSMSLFKKKLFCLPLVDLFGKFGLHLIPTSGHTVFLLKFDSNHESLSKQ